MIHHCGASFCRVLRKYGRGSRNQLDCGTPRFVMSYVRKFIPIGLFDIASLPLACDQHGAAAQQQYGHGSNGRDYV